MVRESDCWHLRSIGEIPLEKVQKNLRELSTFMETGVEVIKSIFFAYHPFALIIRVSQDLAYEPTEQSRALLSYLVSLLPFARLDGPTLDEVSTKEYRRLTNSFDELLRKSIRWVDNTALRLRSEGTIVGDEVMLAFQEEGLAFLLGPEPSDVEQQIRALQYRLQPFNTLISDVFAAKLDGLLAAFKLLVQAPKHHLQDWEVVSNTALTERDAHLLSVEMASQSWDESSHLLIEREGSSRPPFVRLRSTYYAFDAHRLLVDGYAIIKAAVIGQGEEFKSAWREIEQTKNRLLPITFFTAMLSNMHWQRDWPLGEGSVDALFERDEKRLLIQVPWADWTTQGLNPLVHTDEAVALLKEAVSQQALVEQSDDPSLIIDCRDRQDYPMQMKGGTMTLSFRQVANEGTTWEGMGRIKDALGLGLTPTTETNPQPITDEQTNEEFELSSGSSYFTTSFERETTPIEDEEDEETADELFNIADQPSLFDFDYGGLFDPDREREDDGDDDYEYESEAYYIFEDQQISEELEAEVGSLSMADEEMEAGNPDGDVTFYGPSEDEDDADELLDLLKEPEAITTPISVEDLLDQILVRLPVSSTGTFATFVQEGAQEVLDETAALIEEARKAQSLDKRDKMFSVPGRDMTIIVIGARGDAMSAWDRRNNVGAMMYMQKKERWTMVQLEYDETGNLLDATEQIVTVKEFSQSDWKYIMNLSHRILERRGNV